MLKLILPLIYLSSCFEPTKCIEGEKRRFRVTRCIEYTIDNTSCKKYHATKEIKICKEGEFK